MRYLLIDFGASFIKTMIYDSSDDKHGNMVSTVSPFQGSNIISKCDLFRILEEIVEQHLPVEAIVVCSILGGGWIGDTYYSWKSIVAAPKKYCLIGGLFADEPTYHLHCHHGGDVDRLLPIGFVKGVVVYSPLGDTNCVVESLDLQEDEYVINIGTGSQVIHRTESGINIVKFFPAGRAFLVFEKFFAAFGVDFFEQLDRITEQQVYDSNLTVDLNVFPQAKDFLGGGSIQGILEEGFTLTNLLGSILRCFVLQYASHLILPTKTKIRLVGGIPNKLPILKQLFSHYYTGKLIMNSNSTVSNTHVGMIKLIGRYLP